VLNLGDVLLHNARIYPEKTAVITEQASLTYQDLNRRCNILANSLKGLGITNGSAVCSFMRNSVEFIEAFFACQKLGAIFVPVHTCLSSKELIPQLLAVSCSCLIYNQLFSEVVLEVKPELCSDVSLVCIGGSDTDIVNWHNLFTDADDSEPQVAVSPDDISTIFFTSGTTGFNKGVLKTHKTMYMHGQALASINNNPDGNDVMMSTAPLFHIGGFQSLLKMFALGGTFVTVQKLVPDAVIKLIDSCKITQLQLLPPSSYERLYSSGIWREHDLSSVWEVCLSAGKATDKYINHIFEMFPNCHLRPSWGSTEACTLTVTQLSKEAYEKDPSLINTVGKSLPMVSIKLVDEEGKEICAGEGEAYVKSPMVFTQYLNDDGKSEGGVTDDGWYKTGDIMRKDPQTQLYYFVDRKKDMIKPHGENVYAQSVEQIISRFPAVSECAAVGIPSDYCGEAIAVAIVLDNRKNFNMEDLVTYFKNVFLPFNRPYYIAFIDKLPTNGVGKVQKHQLKNTTSIFEKIDYKNA